jgi:phospholipase C
MHRPLHRTRFTVGALALAAGLSTAIVTIAPPASAHPAHPAHPARPADAASPIQHLVVIFGENVSFDHYFGTYPKAANTSGTHFAAAKGTPSVNGLTGALLTANPDGVNPKRYDPSSISDVLTCDQDHTYTDEQKAFDGGKMDRFPQTVGNGAGTSPTGTPCVAGDVMNY